MTPEQQQRIAEITARTNAVTAPPWDCRQYEHDMVAAGGYFASVKGENNRVFIAHARDDVPWLLKEIEALQAALINIAENTETPAVSLEQANMTLRIASAFARTMAR